MEGWLVTTYDPAGAVAAAWERLEAERERRSASAADYAAVLALFPHSYIAAPQIPGFCECGYRQKAEIHR